MKGRTRTGELVEVKMSLGCKYLGCRTDPSLPEICPRAEQRAAVVFLEVSVM